LNEVTGLFKFSVVGFFGCERAVLKSSWLLALQVINNAYLAGDGQGMKGRYNKKQNDTTSHDVRLVCPVSYINN
jgi:hypothetical protein